MELEKNNEALVIVSYLIPRATYETANLNVEQSQYVRMDNAKRINSSLFDRTNGVSPTTTQGHAQRLNGSTNERYGIARSLSVMPGDVINAEVYAKYIDPNSSNWTTALSNLVSQINANAAGVVIDGTQYTTSTASFPASMLGHQTTDDNGAPRAYLNWLVFDRNYLFITGGFKQITTAAKEAGTDVAHELVAMPAAITITQPGYVYIYLSNENSTPVEVFFDEFKVTHTKSPVIQTDDYYPFGLTFNSYQRENGIKNLYQYNGKEMQDELGLDWLDYGARMYDPACACFHTVDPKANEFPHQSPYSAMDNNPVNKVDPDGQAAGDPPGKFGYVLGVRLGLGNSGLNFNLTGSIGYQFGSPNTNVSTFLSGSVYGGSQLGTGPKGGFGFDVSGGAYLMAGKGTGTAHNFYTLNYNTPSPFQNTSDLSVSWGQMVTYNSAINKYNSSSNNQEHGPKIQTQGLFGMRLGNAFSLSYNNDATSFPTFAGLLRKPFGIEATDAAWTGGITFNVAGVEAGYQNFSGNRLLPYPGLGVGGKYPQTGYHKSLNKASNFLQYNGMRLEYFSDAWFQNFIHNNISHESTYDYNYRGVNASGGTGTGD